MLNFYKFEYVTRSVMTCSAKCSAKCCWYSGSRGDIREEIFFRHNLSTKNMERYLELSSAILCSIISQSLVLGTEQKYENNALFTDEKNILSVSCWGALFQLLCRSYDFIKLWENSSIS